MAVAHDAATLIGTGTGTIEGTHTPSGTPRGVVVAIVQDGSAEEVTAVTYGGVALTKQVFKGQATAEAGSAQFWFLGSGVPTGAQTVKVTVSGSNTRAVTCMTLTGSEDLAVAATGSTAAESATNPSVSLETGNLETVAYGATFSGEQASGVGVGAGLTQLTEGQLTTVSTTYNTLRRTENPTANTTVSWTYSNDEAASVGIAVKEASKEPEKLPEVRGVGAISSGTATFSPEVPTGTETNDLLLMFIESGGATTGTEANTVPTVEGPWTEVLSEKKGNTRLTVFRCITPSASPTRKVSDTGDHQMARIVGIKKGTFNETTPVNISAVSTQASTKSVKCPKITTTVANCLVFAAASGNLPDAAGEAQFSAQANSSLTSVTERIDNTVTAGDGGALMVASGLKATAGEVEETTATAVTEAERAVATLAIAPPQTPKSDASIFRRPHRGLLMTGRTRT